MPAAAGFPGMGLDSFGVPAASYDTDQAGGILALAIAMVVVGGFVHAATRMVAKKSQLHQSMVAGFLALLAAQLGYVFADDRYGIVGLALALCAFVLVVSGVNRMKIGQGAAVGALAWVMWILATISLGYVQDHWH
jgi:hypothetical protein